MPELPEVEVLAHHLRPALRGKMVRGVIVHRQRVIAPTSERALKRALTGAKFKSLSRRGKYLLFEFRSPALRKKINARKKDYVHFIENLVAEVQRVRGSKASVTPRAAAFALLGMINWIYQWYRPEGSLQEESLGQQYTAIFFQGAFT